MPAGILKRVAVAALGWFAPAGAAVSQASPPPPTQIGMNLAEVRYYSSTAPFANLAIGSDWNDSRWQRIAEEHQTLDGDIRSLPADGVATRFLLFPPTGPEGFEVRCTFAGSGTLTASGMPGPVESGPNTLRFRMVNERGKQTNPWLILKDVDPKRPFRDLDCRDARLDRSVRFRPEFIATLRGYRVIRFMDWQNANANEAVPWRDRHTTASTRLDRDGVAIEDMLALTRELGADPWFVMPWNADDEYMTQFARMVREGLPAGRSAYVEVGNEVWNGGFAVAKQAVKEGLERKLGANDMEAGMRRYAERTTEVMRLWEAAFAGRRGLVRVLAAQHVWPATAETALSFRDTASHVDALATAPYFGTVLGGTGNTRESSLKQLRVELANTLKMAADNRRIALGYGKRYIGYEAGQGLVLPAQVPLSNQLQHAPEMYDLYREYLAAWRRDSGDVLCLFNSVYRPTSWGSWGLAEWEDETPAEAPKLRAVREAMRAGKP
ncbi:hypothetical protein [uncultured Sphingomonas sp.]|uniref:hypothetical protein n=1 Tax=uncultured Sphingomonas sp. TaxID=158754 RepID=UPI0035CBC49C